MSGQESMMYCSKCKTNRSSLLFTHPSRATPYKTCSNCRSRVRARRNPHPFQVQPVQTAINAIIEPEIGNDIGVIEVEAPIQAGVLIGEESQLGDDPIIQLSQRETREYQDHLEIQRLLQLEDESEENANDNNIVEIDQVFDDGNEGQSLFESNDNIGQSSERVPRVTRRLPPWLAPRRLNRAVPAGYVSQYKCHMPVHDLGDRSSICPFCKALHWPQERVHASSIQNPRFQTCCKEGQVIIEPIPEAPDFLRRLWTSEEGFAKQFRKQSRQYNRAFAFTSFNFTPDRRLEDQGIRGGIKSFSIHGEIFHQISAVPRQGVAPSYAQLYFLDPDEANGERVRQSNLDPWIVEEISSIILDVNPFVSYYHTAFQSLQISNLEQRQNQTETERRVVLNPQYKLILQEGTDRRRYNIPTAREFAIVIPDEVESDVRDVVLFIRNSDGTLSQNFQYIHRGHPAYLPLHYVLFFPFGNPGYRWNLRVPNANQRVLGNLEQSHEEQQDGAAQGKVSPRQYYRYHLFSRRETPGSPIKFNALIHGERLFQQLVCDMYACVDDTILNWYRANQDTIRSDLYSGVMDALRHDHSPEVIGKPVILSASYHGGDRHMAKCYQNAMAITRVLGKPTIFTTMTANPNWPEIKRYLEHSQSPDMRPDLIAIVFKLKFDFLLRDIKERHILGKCIGYDYAVEYQKRGLPHVHLLIYLHEHDIPKTPEQVDELVMAQIPTNDPALAEIVKSQLTHGPCGPGFPNAPCYRDGKCSKGYPKQFCETTVLADNSYPIYARPNNGITWGNDRFTFDNRWVVPYNPYLTKKYGAHINMEIARGVHAIKYLAKYVYKGSDRASISVDNRIDEISMTLQGRYISPVQAIWRLFGYSTHEEKPAVLMLPYHLKGEHRVSFAHRLGPQQLAAAIETQSSLFLDWMKYNATHTDGRDLLYPDFPLFYTHHKNRGWQIRKKGQTIGRLPMAVPRQGERFYLRTLLTLKPGVQSFEDLYTVDGITYEQPSAACRALGLTFDDSEWYSLFNEIKDISTAGSLRQTFAAGLAHCVINGPQSIWDHFRAAFTDDCLHRIRRLEGRLISPPLDWDDERCRADFGLWLFGENLRHLDLDWRTARLRGPTHSWTMLDENPLLTEALSFDREAEDAIHSDCLAKLSPGQLLAYDKIVSTIDNDRKPNTFFIQGPAGTGKTFLYKTLCSKYRSQGKVVLCVASSGIASLLLPNGRTAHSMFRIPVECNETSVCDISGQSKLASLLRKTSLIIWDEVTLQLKHNFGAVDRTLQSLKGNKELFGGIPVVMGGDFAQILPVVKRGGKDEIINACIRFWSKWHLIQPLFLTENMRVVTGESNQRFASWLSDLPYSPSLYGAMDIPDWMRKTEDRSQFCEFVYPMHSIRDNDISIFRGRAILTSRNDDVNRFNNDIAHLRSVTSRDYFAVDIVQKDESENITDYPSEYLQSLSGSGLPLGKLTLQVGMPIMLLRNYYARRGLCNGTRLIITRLFNHCIKGRIISPDPRFDGQEHIISRMTISSSDDLPFTLTRKQLPVRPCYSMTINKSQGQTLERVGVDLSTPVFSHGQLYVALSRVTNIDNLIILLPPGTIKTQNIVYPEVLLRPPII